MIYKYNCKNYKHVINKYITNSYKNKKHCVKANIKQSEDINSQKDK